MKPRQILLYVAVVVPALILAAVGVTHPQHLTAQNAEYWRNLHIAILPIVPLVGFAPWLVVRGHDAFVSWLTAILGFVYAVFYSALDVLAGIGAGGLKLDGMGAASGIGVMYDLGRNLGFIGSIALIAVGAVVGLALFRRVGVSSLPGTALVIIGAVLFLKYHIYFPFGVLGQVCLAVGFAALVFAVQRPGRIADAARLTTASRPG
jgi:hypothetical protein